MYCLLFRIQVVLHICGDGRRGHPAAGPGGDADAEVLGDCRVGALRGRVELEPPEKLYITSCKSDAK